MSPEDIVSLSEGRGLGALATTDDNTIEGAIAVRERASIPVIVGQEISTAEGELVGLFLQEQAPRGLSAMETTRLIKRQGGLVGVPHPLDRFRSESLDAPAVENLTCELDVAEALNGRVTVAADNLRSERFASGEGLMRSAGSDAHSQFELGRGYVEMEPFQGRDGFLRGLGDGEISGAVSPFWVHFFSILAKVRSKLRRG
jgi:predicted metal-dependent phosphoesterase TrpH